MTKYEIPKHEGMTNFECLIFMTKGDECGEVQQHLILSIL